MDTIASLMQDYTAKITKLAEEACAKRMIDTLWSSVQAAGKTKPGHTKDGRKKPPPQLCPVPGCKNKAAPVFGMVCGAHKNVPKKRIDMYRLDRRIHATKKAGRNR